MGSPACADLEVREPSEGRLLAATRNASKPTTTLGSTSSTAPPRISSAKIREPRQVTNLLALQTDSFDWLLGNEKWKDRVEARRAEGRDELSGKSGLAEIFEEISPIEDFQQTMSLSFSEPEFYEPKYSVDECKERDMP